jgi:hypothetical protein
MKRQRKFKESSWKCLPKTTKLKTTKVTATGLTFCLENPATETRKKKSSANKTSEKRQFYRFDCKASKTIEGINF